MPAIFPRFPYHPNRWRRLYAIYNRSLSLSEFSARFRQADKCPK